MRTILTSILLIVAFLIPNLSLFAFIAFLPLFRALNNKKTIQAFFISYLAGIVFFAGIVYWVMYVTLAGAVLLVLYLGLYFAIFGVVVSKIKGVYLKTLTAASIWVLLEYIRSYLLTGFGWALLGYSQYKNLFFIQIADITGSYGVSFLIVLTNVFIYNLFYEKEALKKNKTKFIFYIILWVIAIASTFAYGFYKLNQREEGAELKISVIQGNVPQELKWNSSYIISIIERYFNLTKDASADKADLIIWPEAAFPEVLNIQENEDVNFITLRNLIKNINIPLLGGFVILEGDNYYNSAIFISKEGTVSERYDKLHLVPFGEYIPLKYVLKFLETIVPIGNFTRGNEFTIFKMPEKEIGFSVLVCFEDLFPGLSREFTKRGANFLVNITNDAWFKQSPASYQHLSASVFRAIENRRPLVRSANTGISGFIDINGRLNLFSDESGKHIFVKGIKTDNIKKAVSLSFYTRFGDVFIFICIVVVVFSLFVYKRNKRK